ncbi:MAG: cell division protein ZapA [bacterium]
MNQDNNVLKINIYGTEYPIKGDAETNREYIQKVAEYVDQKMREIDQNTQSKSSLKVAILAALNITDELFREREEKDLLNANIGGKIKNLSNLLDHYLKDTTD